MPKKHFNSQPIKTKKRKPYCKRKTDDIKTEHVNFICFYGSVLSRLSYFDDTQFAMLYANIFGNVIPTSMLHSINNSPDIMNDNLTFPDIVDKCEKYVDFNKLNMPQRINHIIGESKYAGNDVSITQKLPTYLKYISLAWSRYGEVYILVDLRMKDCIWVLFRGTYSNKTAAAYTKLSSIVPLTVCKQRNEKYLYGIFEITVECIHTIIESMNYLAEMYLNPDAKIYTIGHSLGGAMSTIFTYLWQSINNDRKYRFHKTICCLSYGAPRCFNSVVSNNFCKYIKSGHIIYKRIVTRGDPVPALPSKYIPQATYSHPCSDMIKVLPKITLNCGDTMNYLSVKPKYNDNLLCKTKKQHGYIALNPMAHSNYLNILFLKAISIRAFLTGFFRWTTREIMPDQKGNSICRVIFFNGMRYKSGFFQLSSVSGDDKLREDIFMTNDIFKRIIKMATVLNMEMGVLPMNCNDNVIDVKELANRSQESLVC
jgi:hypothetical protein